MWQQSAVQLKIMSTCKHRAKYSCVFGKGEFDANTKVWVWMTLVIWPVAPIGMNHPVKPIHVPCKSTTFGLTQSRWCFSGMLQCLNPCCGVGNKYSGIHYGSMYVSLLKQGFSTILSASLWHLHIQHITIMAIQYSKAHFN